jgi:hypothetical protein
MGATKAPSMHAQSTCGNRREHEGAEVEPARATGGRAMARGKHDMARAPRGGTRGDGNAHTRGGLEPGGTKYQTRAEGGGGRRAVMGQRRKGTTMPEGGSERLARG